MSHVVDIKPKRVPYVEQTKAAILDSATDLFVEQGYTETSIDVVAKRAQFTKGAVYRHWPDKRALFAAVLERVEADAMHTLVSGLDLTHSHPWDVAMQAIGRYVDLAGDERYRRIVIEQGPAVLGWDDWRLVDKQHTGSLIHTLLAALIERGEITPQPIELLARLCRALIGETAFAIAQSENPEETKKAGLQVLETLVGALRIQKPPTK